MLIVRSILGKTGAQLIRVKPKSMETKIYREVMERIYRDRHAKMEDSGLSQLFKQPDHLVSSCPLIVIQPEARRRKRPKTQ